MVVCYLGGRNDGENGLDLEHMRLDDSPRQMRERILPGHNDEFWFGTLERFSAVKNQAGLILAFARVAAWMCFCCPPCVRGCPCRCSRQWLPSGR